MHVLRPLNGSFQRLRNSYCFIVVAIFQLEHHSFGVHVDPCLRCKDTPHGTTFHSMGLSFDNEFRSTGRIHMAALEGRRRLSMEVSPRGFSCQCPEKQSRLGCVQLLLHFIISACFTTGGYSSFCSCPYCCYEMCRE